MTKPSNPVQGDTWFDANSRPYVCAKIRDSKEQEKLVNLLIATGARHSTLFEIDVSQPPVTIEIKNKSTIMTLGPCAPQHQNSENGVLGMDVLSKFNFVLDFGQMKISLS